ncbi:hypothetical protein AAVH_38355 [Aphelenchoides avenae]|nr:hypothetical protein AAVH_38355 [Aphelenchus avenae]
MHLRAVLPWLTLLLASVVAVFANAQEANEPFAPAMPDYPMRVIFASERDPTINRLIKRAVKRERIIMDALGGDYLVKRGGIA